MPGSPAEPGSAGFLRAGPPPHKRREAGMRRTPTPRPPPPRPHRRRGAGLPPPRPPPEAGEGERAGGTPALPMRVPGRRFSLVTSDFFAPELPNLLKHLGFHPKNIGRKQRDNSGIPAKNSGVISEPFLRPTAPAAPRRQ